MTLTARVLLIILFCLHAGVGFSQNSRVPQPVKSDDSLLQNFFSDFNLSVAAEKVEARLLHAPKDEVALFIRMETAELHERPEVVLDSALRLCALPAAPELLELARSEERR